MLLQKKPSPDARVLRRRDYEDKLYSMQQGVQVSWLCSCNQHKRGQSAFAPVSLAQPVVKKILLLCTGAA